MDEGSKNAPSEVELDEGTLEELRLCASGAAPALFLRRWRCPRGERGIIVIVPGFSDHGGRYPHLVRAALARGFGVLALDTRGHGRSDGRRGHIEGFRDYEHDLERALSWLDIDAPARPLALWGHSMGGLIALCYASSGLARGHALRAVVLSAPALRVKVPVPRWKDALARALDHAVPWAPFASPIDPTTLSRDLEVGRRYMADPLVHNVCSPRLYLEMETVGRRLLASPVDYGLPTLFLHGLGDRIIDPDGTRAAYERYPLVAKELRLYAEARHELHNEPSHAEVFAGAFAFLEAPLRA